MIKDYVKLVIERSATKFSFCFLIFGFILSFASTSLAQKEKYNPSMCVYLENSERIFVGTFQNQTENSSVQENESYTIADFSVNQPLQGIRQNEDKISVVNYSYKKHLQIGEMYLVFLRYDQATKRYKLAAPFPVIFLNNTTTNTKSPQITKSLNDFHIAFAAVPIAADEKTAIKTTVTSNENTYLPKFTSSNVFTIVYSRNIKTNVLMEIPRQLNVSIVYGSPIADIKTEKDKTTVKYELKAMNQSCEYREFLFQNPEKR